MDKIEVTQNARQAAFDAYLTCYEIVPNDLWLQALLDGKHDGDEMAQAFARFERDILATRTDATPVVTDVAALVEAIRALKSPKPPIL